ncbi:Interleukin-15 [Apodemus speciosus]|uniref:Interleukin n=1 Tax=Apodemus speciosus TaxID=105296 RepID=A0ABQ0F232_APOSI
MPRGVLDGWQLETHRHSQFIVNTEALTWTLSNENFDCVSVGLPKTEANWIDVRYDLEKIERLIQSIHIDTTLYTDSDFHPSCKVTAMNCFLLELQVILHEYSNMTLNETVRNVLYLANSSLSSNKNVAESGCKECEELEEKSFREFLQSFIRIVQMFINTS